MYNQLNDQTNNNKKQRMKQKTNIPKYADLIIIATTPKTLLQTYFATNKMFTKLKCSHSMEATISNEITQFS